MLSSTLCSVGAAFLDILSLEDAKSITTIPHSDKFPYREAQTGGRIYIWLNFVDLNILLGKDCFVIESNIHKICPSHYPAIPLDPTAPHHILAHIGAHILFGSVEYSSELCGFCLQPSPLCRFYLGKGSAWGKKKAIRIVHVKGCKSPVDVKKIKYSTAFKSMASSSCSNILIQCPWCSPSDPAIWWYNLCSHFVSMHPTADLTPLGVE